MLYAQLLGATALMLAVIGPDGLMPTAAEARALQTGAAGDGDALVATTRSAAAGRALLGALPNQTLPPTCAEM